MPMKSAKVTVKGTSPLLMHAYPMVPLEAIEKKSQEEQAKHAEYRDPDTGFLYVPGVAIQRGCVAAATYSKGKGRGSLQKQAAACLLISPERVSLGVKDYVIDSRPVVIAATKGRIIRHRPRLDDWQLTFTVEWDDLLLKETEVRRILDDLGARVGLLDFRPEKKGPFGRFVIVQWVS
jgi:hypothetical protein